MGKLIFRLVAPRTEGEKASNSVTLQSIGEGRHRQVDTLINEKPACFEFTGFFKDPNGANLPRGSKIKRIFSFC